MYNYLRTCIMLLIFLQTQSRNFVDKDEVISGSGRKFGLARNS
jgi:hypothetical protein